jgi:hypothetical protein
MNQMKPTEESDKNTGWNTPTKHCTFEVYVGSNC